MQPGALWGGAAAALGEGRKSRERAGQDCSPHPRPSSRHPQLGSPVLSTAAAPSAGGHRGSTENMHSGGPCGGSAPQLCLVLALGTQATASSHPPLGLLRPWLQGAPQTVCQRSEARSPARPAGGTSTRRRRWERTLQRPARWAVSRSQSRAGEKGSQMPRAPRGPGKTDE